MSEYKNKIINTTMGYCDLFIKKIRTKTFILLYLWFYRYLVYFGIQYSLEDLGYELHLNMIFLALAELMAYLIGG